jgi:hypothetical protein
LPVREPETKDLSPPGTTLAADKFLFKPISAFLFPALPLAKLDKS